MKGSSKIKYVRLKDIDVDTSLRIPGSFVDHTICKNCDSEYHENTNIGSLFCRIHFGLFIRINRYFTIGNGPHVTKVFLIGYFNCCGFEVTSLNLENDDLIQKKGCIKIDHMKKPLSLIDVNSRLNSIFEFCTTITPHQLYSYGILPPLQDSIVYTHCGLDLLTKENLSMKVEYRPLILSSPPPPLPPSSSSSSSSFTSNNKTTTKNNSYGYSLILTDYLRLKEEIENEKTKNISLFNKIMKKKFIVSDILDSLYQSSKTSEFIKINHTDEKKLLSTKTKASLIDDNWKSENEINKKRKIDPHGGNTKNINSNNNYNNNDITIKKNVSYYKSIYIAFNIVSRIAPDQEIFSGS